MKYFLVFFILIVTIIGIGFYVFSSETESDWKIKHTLKSPNNIVTATVKCLDGGGATVGFYCNLYIENKNGNARKMMMVRDVDIGIKWISSNILEALVSIDRPIYNFDNVYWNELDKQGYYIRLKYR